MTPVEAVLMSKRFYDYKPVKVSRILGRIIDSGHGIKATRLHLMQC